VTTFRPGDIVEWAGPTYKEYNITPGLKARVVSVGDKNVYTDVLDPDRLTNWYAGTKLAGNVECWRHVARSELEREIYDYIDKELSVSSNTGG